MLFQIDPATRFCKVFELLNNTLLYFFENSIRADEFSEELFPLAQNDVCWDNQPTQDKYRAVFAELPESSEERQILCDSIKNNQDLPTFFSDTSADIPLIEGDRLNKALENLTSHLFSRTKDLAKAEEQSKDCIEQHYRDFLDKNGKVCPLCGTELLSQDRSGINDLDQWRADYDHLLCKSEYAIYAVHPQNFIPTCHTCNSKAKGKRNLLFNDSGIRRKAFYPFKANESCARHITVSAEFLTIEQYKQEDHNGAIHNLEISYSGNEDFKQKAIVWCEVYQVPTRVRQNLLAKFEKRILADLCPEDDFDDFSSQLTRHTARYPPDIKSSEWRFWWHLLYRSIQQMPELAKRDIWEVIAWHSIFFSSDDFSEEFGI